MEIRENPENTPLIITIDKESIKTPEGKFTQLGLLLSAIGCTFTKKNRQDTHDNRGIKAATMQIVNHERLLDGLIIKMIDDYRDFSSKRPEEKAHGQEELGEYFLKYGHPEDFSPDGKIAQQLSLDDIDDEMGLHSIIRGGRVQEFTGTGAKYEIKQLMSRKVELIQMLGRAISQQLQKEEAERNLDTRQRMINAIRTRIGLPPQDLGLVQEDETQIKFGKSIYDMTDALKQKHGKSFTKGEPLTNPQIIHLWVRLKAIERRMNDILGINTQAELARMRQKATEDEAALDRQQHPYKYMLLDEQERARDSTANNDAN